MCRECGARPTSVEEFVRWHRSTFPDGDFNYEYVLEVSSPGIDRPLTCEEDFDFWVGNKVFVKLKKPINKTKKITGTLKGIFNKNIKLEDVDGDNALEIEVDNIKDINIIWSPEVTSLN